MKPSLLYWRAPNTASGRQRLSSIEIPNPQGKLTNDSGDMRSPNDVICSERYGKDLYPSPAICVQPSAA